jgi:hypothetical protein
VRQPRPAGGHRRPRTHPRRGDLRAPLLAALGGAQGQRRRRRWGERRAFEVLYLGRPRDSVVVEAYRHLVDDELDDAQALAATVLERRIITCRVAVPNILDLRQQTAQAAVGLSDTQLCSPVGDYVACHAVGAAAHQLGLVGIIVPAATQLGQTLALFPTNLPVEHWPTVIARDIWHGLPADPRWLRAVDDDAS